MTTTNLGWQKHLYCDDCGAVCGDYEPDMVFMDGVRCSDCAAGGELADDGQFMTSAYAEWLAAAPVEA